VSSTISPLYPLGEAGSRANPIQITKESLGLLDDHARVCVISGEQDRRELRTEETIAAVARLIRRG
jgi:hypothetical protein